MPPRVIRTASVSAPTAIPFVMMVIDGRGVLARVSPPGMLGDMLLYAVLTKA